MKIILSLIVHENVEVIKDQIKNISKYINNPLILIHCSKQFMDYLQLQQLLDEFSLFCIVNPNQIYTGYADGSQMKAHLLNIHYLFENKIPFDYFTLLASNQMFIRKGVENYMANYEVGYTCNKVIFNDNNKPTNLLWVSKKAYKDTFLNKKCDLKTKLKIYYGNCEGSFFNKDITINLYEKLFPKALNDICGINFHAKKIMSSKNFNRFLVKFFGNIFYYKEEVYFSTISIRMLDNYDKIGKGYCYMSFKFGLNIYQEDISEILKNDYKNLDPNYAYNDVNNIYCVKRVNRNIEDPLRKHLNKL